LLFHPLMHGLHNLPFRMCRLARADSSRLMDQLKKLEVLTHKVLTQYFLASYLSCPVNRTTYRTFFHDQRLCEVEFTFGI
jgi:hypothetical protein